MPACTHDTACALPSAALEAAQARVRDLAAARQPGYSLAQPFYCDEDVFRVDLERVFKRYWLFAGHVCQIPRKGDYFTWRVGNDPLVIVRGEGGAVHAHHNVCPHRGSILTDKPCGHANKFVCPYHQWVFEPDGRLFSARHMPEDFEKAAFGLRPVHVRVLHGLIYICLAENPPPFEPIARDVGPFMEPYEMERVKSACSKHYELHANWKLITENFRECYHCAGGHPEYCRVVLGAGTDHPVYSKDKHKDVWADREAHWKRSGLATGAVRFKMDSWYHCARYPFRPGAVSQTPDGKPCAPLLGRIPDRDAGVFAIVTYPNFWHESSGDYFMTIRITPLGASRCDADVAWYVREDAVEGRDYDPERVSAFWRATAEQDWKLGEDNQAGILSSAYRPGPYGPLETEIELFIHWYLKQVAG
ncbi:MAG: aromatic ring-hydroxylating dioxygenase subunit alpha [Planctomycetes bacterium]|nr:aromatic ring-hydroxylating dioxygenase subunit alpha [Planctomycetota bacterium]